MDPGPFMTLLPGNGKKTLVGELEMFTVPPFGFL
jgi:hypothetical protein